MTTLQKLTGVPALLAGLLCTGIVAAAESTKAAKADDSRTIVTVDGLACNVAGPGAFEAVSFQVGATSATGGGGAPKVTLGDLSLQKQLDTCSLRLFRLALTGEHIKKIVVSNVDRNNRPLLTILLEDVVISSFQLQDSDETSESLSLNYFHLTMTDSTGNSTGPLTH
jgi:type VI protein secretion system component Hcp